MAEEEVNYASVVFKTKKHSPSEANKEEETVYSDVKVRSKTTEKTADTNAGLLPDKKTNSRGHCYQQVACCLGILCVILLLGIIAVCVYVAQCDKSLYCLKSKITNLSAENQNLTTQNQELETQNQDLESQRNNLTEQIQNMEKKWNELNVSRAQWSIDAYCPKPKNQNRQCKACQKGWILSESSCYAINDADDSGQKTWEEAREDCRGKISDLVVKLDQKEKKYVDFNWGSYGYWIGLRAEAGNWTWINGTFLKTQDYWTETPSGEAHCVISVGGTPSKRWKAVKCDEKHRWICEKKALSV